MFPGEEGSVVPGMLESKIDGHWRSRLILSYADSKEGQESNGHGTLKGQSNSPRYLFWSPYSAVDIDDTLGLRFLPRVDTHLSLTLFYTFILCCNFVILLMLNP